MKKAFRWLVTLLLAGSTGAAWLGWKKVESLEADNSSLQAELKSLQAQITAAAENQKAQREKSVERERAESVELSRLRNEVSQLRTGTREAEKLRSENQTLRGENQQLRTATVKATAPATATTPAGTAGLFPRDGWTFAGYTSPESALVSAIWAMREGKPQAYLDSLSPEERARLEKSWQNKTEAEIAAKHQQDVSAISGMRILGQQAVSADEILMDVYIEGTGRMEKVSMKRYGNDWKFGGYIRPAKTQ